MNMNKYDGSMPAPTVWIHNPHGSFLQAVLWFFQPLQVAWSLATIRQAPLQGSSNLVDLISDVDANSMIHLIPT